MNTISPSHIGKRQAVFKAYQGDQVFADNLNVYAAFALRRIFPRLIVKLDRMEVLA